MVRIAKVIGYTMHILQKYPKSMRRFHLLFAVALLCISVIAWVESGNHVKQQLTQAISLARDNAEHDASDIALGMQRNLSLLHGIPSTFAKARQVAEALQARSPSVQGNAQAALSEFLGSAVADLNAVSVLWVMDRQGNCIAASNSGKEESFVGTHYADRDYFKMSMNGLSGRQFAIGKNTGIPGLFFSAPVRQDGSIVGVVAAKVDLPFLSLWLSQANAFVTDEYGVVILDTHDRLLMHTFDSTVAQDLTLEQTMQRYRLSRVPALEVRKIVHPGFAEMLLVDQQTTPTVHTQHSIDNESRLLVHVLGPVPYELSMDTERIRRFALETGFGVLVLLLISTAVFYVRNIQRAHAALAVHKLRLDEAQRLAQVGSWELTLATGAMRWSDEVHRIFRLEPSAVNPSLATFLDRIQETDRPALSRILSDLSGVQERVECSVGMVRMSGEAGRMSVQLQAVTGKDGVVEGFRGTLRDTTEQDLLESELRRAKMEAESANRMKSDFLATISHELRTPMNAILGMSHIVLQSDLSATQQSHIQTVHRSAEYLLGLINEILDFSKMEAGKYTFERREFLLREVTGKLADRLEPLAEAKGLEFQLDMPSTLPARLMGDPVQLGKILSALTSNSIKFTQEGRVSVGIEVASQTASVIELHFWVNDTGVGMTPEQQAGLFKAFGQLDSSRTRKFGGTGLGLVLSQRIVEMMGGRIWVQSKFGTGTTVHFTVPFEPFAETQAAAPQLVPETAAIQGHLPENFAGLHILLVEDNPVNQELGRQVLKRFGIAVTLANHGQEALDILATRADFDAILMDCHMPVMDGYTATRHIRTMEALNGIPVIAVTANVSSNDRKKISESGMCDVVAKPYRVPELMDALLRWVRPASVVAAVLADLPKATGASLPPLPGIDVQYGLSIAMSDAHLYKKLLQLFSQSEVNFGEKFQSAWQAGDRVHAARLAHSLKGVSASIGAKDVQSAALALERACHEGRTGEEIQVLLERTLQALQRVLDSLAALKEPDARNEAAAVSDPAHVRKLVTRLTALLARHDLSAYDVAEELAAASKGSSIAPWVTKLTKAIDRFDLDGAQEALKKVSLALEGP